MNAFVYFFGSGLAFFVGIALVLAALGLSTIPLWPNAGRFTAPVATIGAVLVGLSATPLPYWFYGLLLLSLLAWAIVPAIRQQLPACSSGVIRLLVALLWLTAAAMEIPYQLPPKLGDQRRFTTLSIVADSVTAGLGDPRVTTWPRLLSVNRSLEICDLSHAGETVESAMLRLAYSPLGDGLVLLEIGGNDLLGPTTMGKYAQDLEELLTRVCTVDRTVLMFELPSIPFHNEFGRIQRRLARKYGVILIPKRYFVDVLTAANATTDGIHLSQHGQDLMADLIWRLIEPIIVKEAQG